MSLLDPKAIRDWCKTTFHKNSDILQTVAEVEENENTGKTVDALVVKEVFQSVGNGKSLIASAITDKGVQTDATATFQEMATNIGQIETGGGGGGICPIESPYLFTFNGTLPYSTSNGLFTIPFPVTNINRLVIKKFVFSISRSSTSNSSGYFTCFIIGDKNDGTTNYNVKSWDGSASGSTNKTVYVANITTDFEIDLTGIEKITKFQIYKSSVSGTVINSTVNIDFQAELYF